jgi:hypothetical protein
LALVASHLFIGVTITITASCSRRRIGDLTERSLFRSRRARRTSSARQGRRLLFFFSREAVLSRRSCVRAGSVRELPKEMRNAPKGNLGSTV